MFMKTTLISFIGVALLNSCQLTPDESNLKPIERLKEGNKRVMDGHSIHPDETLERIKAIKDEQHPYVVVVSCSDSRVPPELVFDQGLGSVFAVRTAGNVIGDYELGSIEYAVEHLNVQTVVVMGHEGCGAIKAYLEKHHSTRHEGGHGHIKNIIQYIESEKEEQYVAHEHKHIPLQQAVLANILHGVHAIKGSEPILNEQSKKGKLIVKGALYNMDNGKVTFLDHLD